MTTRKRRATRTNLKKAVRDEQQAIASYGRASRTARKERAPAVAKKFTHIKREERQHKREFKRLLRRGSSR